MLVAVCSVVALITRVVADFLEDGASWGEDGVVEVVAGLEFTNAASAVFTRVRLGVEGAHLVWPMDMTSNQSTIIHVHWKSILQRLEAKYVTVIHKICLVFWKSFTFVLERK